MGAVTPCLLVDLVGVKEAYQEEMQKSENYEVQ